MLVVRFCSLFFLLFYVSFLSTMSQDAKNHIVNTHLHNNNIVYKDIIKNKDTGILSAVCVNRKEKLIHRKTLFSQDCDPGKALNSLLSSSQRGDCLFVNEQKGNSSQKRVEYRQHPVDEKFVVGVVKDSANNIKTAYPIFRYIFSQELEKDNEFVYVGTKKNKNGQLINLNYSAKDIKKASRDGVFLACRNSKKTGKPEYLVDISKSFTNSDSLFSGKKEERGSIVVETDWINKR